MFRKLSCLALLVWSANAICGNGATLKEVPSKNRLVWQQALDDVLRAQSAVTETGAALSEALASSPSLLAPSFPPNLKLRLDDQLEQTVRALQAAKRLYEQQVSLNPSSKACNRALRTLREKPIEAYASQAAYIKSLPATEVGAMAAELPTVLVNTGIMAAEAISGIVGCYYKG